MSAQLLYTVLCVLTGGASVLWLIVPDDRMLGRMYEADRNLPAAVSALERWVGEHPEDEATLLYLVQLRQNQGRPDQARAILRAMIDRWPQRVDLRRRLIGIMESENQVARTLPEYEALYALTPNDRTLAEKLADLYRHLGHEGQLIDQLKRVINLGADPALSAELMSLLMFHQRYDEVVELLQVELSRRPGSAVLRRQLAQVYGKSGRTEEAIAMWQMLNREHAGDREVFESMLAAMLDGGQVEGALDAIEERLDHHPDDMTFTDQLVSLLVHHAREAAAIATLERTLARRWSARHGMLLARLRVEQGEKKAALAVYRTLVGDDTIERRLKLRLRKEMAELLVARRAHRSAATQLEIVAESRPRDLAVRTMLVNSYEAMKRPRKALPHARARVKLKPEQASFRRDLVWLLDAVGQHRAALPHTRWLVQHTRPSVALLRLHGRIAEAAGSQQEAIKAYERALKASTPQ
ncbi:MAG: tetratricopeptide repeat protein [Bradymonadia bacterium]